MEDLGRSLKEEAAEAGARPPELAPAVAVDAEVVAARAAPAE
jgi:hypothetical protein